MKFFRRLKPLSWILLSLAAVSIVYFLVARFWPKTNVLERVYYDWTHSNPYVKNRGQLREFLNNLERVSYEQIPDDFRRRTGMNRRAERERIKRQRFYAVTKKDLYKKIAGSNRLMSIVSGDNQYGRHSIFSDEKFYFHINPSILYRFIEVQNELEKAGHDRDGIRIISGHRTPGHNRNVGGKSESRHMMGDALDIKIGDIDGDGMATREDKKLLLPILRRVIGNSGGLGVYAMSVHIDARGFRARW